MQTKPETRRTAIEIRDLRVDYGDFVAVDDVSLQVPAGEVFGLVGPNGAGKTSTFRVLATLMEPTYGEVFLDGVDIQEDIEMARRIVGYMPDLAPVPSDLKVGEFLEFHAAAYGLGTRQQQRDRVAECLEEVGMTEQRKAWCAKLSRGQTQRVVLAKTLLHRPRVMILDEPASGLDPLARRDLKDALRRLVKTGATVFVSSHILSELAEMCTSLCVMNRGKLLAAGTAEEVRRLMGNGGRRLTMKFVSQAEAAADWMQGKPGIEAIAREGESLTLAFAGEEDHQAELMAGLVMAGFRMVSFEERKSSFEEILVEVAESNRKR
ncbi:ABC-2 type transport system ATP-binding protein [Haloferula luteola]|uniref:ABC-2 type transport system ATP-binding protein n=1 Tax=Haloferula luteola TaxID=595692 RepID=A0A840UX71_9BACT|nr:ABC transporter ATP-binding protein [Haloferula luteola]MBB5350372.1 ABC-2 type transport system ATP-binding protein [Haloferula luteola]